MEITPGNALNSFKDPGIIKRQPFAFLVLSILLLIIIAAEPVVMLFLIFFCYIASGPIAFIMTWPRRRRLEKAVHKGHEAHAPQEKNQN